MMGENGERIYTDSEVEHYTDERIKLFLEDCRDFSEDINNLSIELNDKDISKLNINSDINELIRNIRDLKKVRDNLDLYDENKKEINRVFDKLKKDFIDLKNKHIHVYNEKVDYINERINEFTKLDYNILSQDIKDLLQKLNPVNRCDVYIDRNWNQNRYLNTLEYDKLLEAYQNIELIEKKLNIKIEEPLDLFTSANYIDNFIKKIRKNINAEMSLTSINSNLDECVSLLERVEDLSIGYSNIKDKLSEDMLIKYDNKIEQFRESIKEIETLLIEKKNNLMYKSTYYDRLLIALDYIDSKHDMLLKKVLEYEGRCTEEVIKVFNNNLEKLFDVLFTIKNKISEHKDKGILNQEQLNNLDIKVSTIMEKCNNINIKLNDELVLLNEENKELHISRNVSKLDKLLTELDGRIKKIDGIIKDKDIRKEIDNLVKNREKDFKSFEHLLLYLRDKEPDRYEELKKQVDGLKERFDKICKNYYGKCPLMVKSTKEIKHLYKKHNKLGLISAGLSSLALLNSAFSLIPAIMYGNTIIGNSIPLFKGVFDFFNKILGGCIGAKINSLGIYRLANGTLLGASTATAALLKSLASFSGGVVAIMFPTFVPQIIFKIKQLTEKMKGYELKERLVNTYNTGREKVEDVTDEVRKKVYGTKVKIEEKKTARNYEYLYQEYLNSKMSIEEFCKKKDLTDTGRQWLELKEQRKNLLEEMKKQEKEKLRELIKESSVRR